MKKRAVLLVFLISLTTFAQKQNKETNKTEINQSTSFKFELMIETSVSSGKLTIEIYDSNEKKQGTFSVGTQLNIQNFEYAHGKINKSLIEPKAGNWKIKIIPINAIGSIQIKTTSFF